jgi:hypothetical protein
MKHSLEKMINSDFYKNSTKAELGAVCVAAILGEFIAGGYRDMPDIEVVSDLILGHVKELRKIGFSDFKK